LLGINIQHADFESRAIWGYTAPQGDADVDGNGHGTHVASTIAGKTYGIAKKANVIAVKVLRSSGFGTTADVIKGIEWVALQAVTSPKKSVANMSLGGGKSLALEAAVEAAILSGVHFAVAAGNS
jgi:cerevisin